MTITDAKKKLDEGSVSALELLRDCIATVEKREHDVRAYLEVFDDAEEQARKADEKKSSGEHGALLGVPLAIKDNILMEGRESTAGSKILEGYHATYDATVITKLKEAGAIFMGRTNLDEFAMGSSTEHSAFKTTKNPHDKTRVPGGSSGGSAAAVSYGGALGALGSDTGGSIRQPASFCGVVGLKPTYGSVSRSGLIALGSSLDVIGPLAKTVDDAELLFSVIKGKDALDMTSREGKDDATLPKTIGVPRSFLEKGIDEDVLTHFEHTLQKLSEEGHIIVDIELAHIDAALAVYYIVMPAEASSNLARFDGVRYGLHQEGERLLDDYVITRGEGFGNETRRRILLGTYVLSAGYYDAYYSSALQVRAALTHTFTKAFEEVDVIAMPTTPTPAFKIGEKAEPLSMYLADIFTVPANLTGIPGISIPCGFVSREGKQLPVGIQFMAPHFSESRLFHVGRVAEHLVNQKNF